MSLETRRSLHRGAGDHFSTALGHHIRPAALLRAQTEGTRLR